MGTNVRINEYLPYLYRQNTSSTAASTQTETQESTEPILQQDSESGAKSRDFCTEMLELEAQLKNEKKLKESRAAELAILNEQKEVIKKAKKGKVAEDGTIKQDETWEDYKTKIPWYKKILRAVSHIAQGGWKAATSLVGYETDKETGKRKWNPIKFAINAGIASVCTALCICTAPISLPIIGATTVGAVASGSLIATGAVLGGAGIIKGAGKAYEAYQYGKPVDFDNAMQDIGEGLTIGAASVLGLRGAGAGLKASALSNPAANIARVTSRNPFTKFGNFLTRTEYVKGGNKLTQFFYDSTINASRAFAHNGRRGRIEFRDKGFLKSSYGNIKDLFPKLGKSKFDSAKNELIGNIQKRLAEIQQELNNSSLNNASKILLNQEQKILNSQIMEINQTLHKTAWQRITSKSKAQKEIDKLEKALDDLMTNHVVKINGKKIKLNDKNVSLIQNNILRYKKLTKEINNLANVRKSTIKNMAFFSNNKNEVEAFTGTARSNRFGRIYDTRKITKEDLTFKNIALSPFKAALWLLGLEFKPWTYLQKSPVSSVYKAQELIHPEYEEGFLTTGLMADLFDMGEKTLRTTVQFQDENGEIKEQEVAMTKELLAQMEEQTKTDYVA